MTGVLVERRSRVTSANTLVWAGHLSLGAVLVSGLKVLSSLGRGLERGKGQGSNQLEMKGSGGKDRDHTSERASGGTTYYRMQIA